MHRVCRTSARVGPDTLQCLKVRTTPVVIQARIVLELLIVGIYGVVATVGCLVGARYLWALGVALAVGGYWSLAWRRVRRIAFSIRYDQRTRTVAWRGALGGGSLSALRLLSINLTSRRGRYRLEFSDSPPIYVYVHGASRDFAALLGRLEVANPRLSYSRFDANLVTYPVSTHDPSVG